MPTIENDPRPPAGATLRYRKEWQRVTDLLAARRSLDAIDQMAINDMVTCWEHTLELEALVEKEGYTVCTAQGKIQNPNVRTLMVYRRAMMQWAKELGLTLRSRSAIQVPEVPAESTDMLGALMSGDDETEQSIQ